MTKEEIPELEPALLDEAKAKMARIFFDSVDVMVVDEIGKNISGEGWIRTYQAAGLSRTSKAVSTPPHCRSRPFGRNARQWAGVGYGGCVLEALCG
jgi:hypothetical protein